MFFLRIAMFKLGELVSIKKTDGIIIKASVYKISSAYVDVQWFENGQLVGKKVYFQEIIEQSDCWVRVRYCVSLYWSQTLLGIIMFSILAIFLGGVIHNYNTSIRVRFYYCRLFMPTI